MFSPSQIFTLLFLMLGPFKILGPFVKITRNADAALTRKLAIYATFYSIIILFIAGFMGERILEKFGIPVSILSLAAGIILFLVALFNILSQFTGAKPQQESTEAPSMLTAMNPLAVPTIVTPYGTSAVIVFIALSPDIKSKLTVGAIVVGIMIINLIIMLVAKKIFKALSIVLAILGSILGIIQVALGIKIIYNSLVALLAL